MSSSATPEKPPRPRAAGVDHDAIAAAVRQILIAVGEDPDRPGLEDTPDRVARFYGEALSGMWERADDHLSVQFESHYDEIVMVKDIPLYSLCEHHLAPFLGRAHVAYMPNTDGCITGLSKLARLVDMFARRLQVQERMTMQIADELERVLAPQGVMVVIEAEHLCMSMRGVRKPGSTTVTSAVRGLFRTNLATREEGMRLLLGIR
jgi:GTP cyclohydrolase I